MEKYLTVLKQCPLFDSIPDNNILSVLKCLNVRVCNFKKHSNVFEERKNHEIGIMLTGNTQILKVDYNGNQNIVANFCPSQIFGEAIVCLSGKQPEMSVFTTADSTIMFIDYNKILCTCANACSFHHILIRNMLKTIAEKNLYLNRKLEHITKRTTREKLLSYLTEQSVINKSTEFSIPFNRQQLADYLAVDRSAMSNELCKLRNEGKLVFDKNKFTLL